MKFYQKPELKYSICALDASLASGIENTGSDGFGGEVDLGDQEFGNED